MAHSVSQRPGRQLNESAFDYLDAHISQVAAIDIPMPLNEPEENAVIVSDDEIIDSIRKFINKDHH